jgi:N-sulfoglucosamine sulfohydrolase
MNLLFKSLTILVVAILAHQTIDFPSNERLFAEETSSRPNVLFLFADDWGRHASIYAKIDGPGSVNDVIKTPNFDSVASEGVLFRSAFVSAPSCTPCRSALFAGQHFWRTGRASILLGAIWDGSNPSFANLLGDDGYQLGVTYKAWSPGTPANATIGGSKYAFAKGGAFNQFSQTVTKRVSEGQSVEEAKAAVLKDAASNFDDFLATRPKDKPFLYWFGPTNVHRKWTRGSGKALWGINPDSLQGKMPPFLADVPEVREDLADYFGEAQAFDAAIGMLVDRLKQTGELENTMIIISGDHGAPGFTHGKCNLYDFGSSVPLAIRWGGAKGGRIVDDLVSLTDIAPTILEAAGVAVPESMTGRSLVDVLKSDQSGQVDPKRTAVYIGRERHVAQARADFKPYPQRAIRTHDFLYIINFKPERWPLGDPYRLDSDIPPTATEITEETFTTLPDEDAGPAKAWLVTHRDDPQWRSLFDLSYGKRPREELYDLKKDSHQIKNVATDPEYQMARMELQDRLMNELTSTNDPRTIDDGSFFENPPMSGPVEPSPDGKKQPKKKKPK